MSPHCRLHRILTLAALALVTSAQAAEKPVSFTRQIKPILSNRCFACHGPDAAERKAELRLDLRESAVEAAIVPGKAQESELLARITSSDPELQMPPAASKKPLLTKAEIDLIRRWIDEGADYDAHWAYTAPTKPAIPAVKDAAWPLTRIDNFIAAAREERGLPASPEADRRTLLRRLSFDVIGLPPAAREVAAFEADSSPQAYEKVVDRLLASRQFGERMAIYWLDVVRYADTAGYHSDNHRDIYAYRDYVIAAFNDNKPFDQFTREQLAGDLLPAATSEQKIASGYNRLLQTTEEGGAQPKEYTAKYQADRVRNTAAIWLASTMGCCECHDHKFDPFTTKDFYRFAAFFADISEKPVGRQEQTKVPSVEQESKLKSLDEQLAALQSQWNATTPELSAAQAKWEAAARAELAASPSAWLIVKPEKAESSGKATLTVQDDASVLSSGKNPAKDNYTITLAAQEPTITALRLEALADSSFGNQGLARGNGNFVLTEVTVELVTADGKTQPVKIAAAEADFSQDRFPIANAIDGKSATGWAVNGHQQPGEHAAAFAFAEPVAGAAGAKLVVKLLHQSQHPRHNMGRFRLALSSAEKPTLSGISLPAAIAAALSLKPEQRSPAQQQQLATHFRSLAPQLEPLRQQIAEVTKQRTALVDSFPTSLVSMSVAPRTVRVLARGNWLDDSGEVVQPGVPEFLSASENKSRLDLAHWMTSRDNPLVARVFVNRLWKLAFGRGIVRSLEDFGSQGEYPTHPQLLDYLAVDFIDSGWDVKRAFKQMLMSRAYRQSSLVPQELLAKDPNNDFFTRQNRFRLPAEMVRDNALAVSGLLVPTIGGPSVKPYQPAGYWQYLNFPKREWQNEKGAGLYRRGLYTYWQRTFLHPSLAAFDAPSREECTVDRPRSNTPQQALVLLNDPTYVEAARALAAKVVAAHSETPARLEFAFQQVLGRSPRNDEIQVLTSLYDKHFREFTADQESAAQLLSVGDLPAPAHMDAPPLAAWTSICRVLLNLHETITRN